ncbi:MAG: hypothetical protein IJV15_02945 [Lachnospiraceae bacterium]|nr:hypothetical protein [Lachnospiraceae bacterium]
MNIFGFFGAISRNVVKWWQIHITPILRIDNNKTGDARFEGGDGSLGNQNAVQTENQAVTGQETQAASQNVQSEVESVSPQTIDDNSNNESSADAMAILNRINKEKNDKRIHDIENARKKREEEERVAAIMSSSKVDVGVFIEEGRHKAEETDAAEIKSGDEDKSVSADSETSREDNSATDEQMRRAQEIIDRLNREAAEDEAKKQAEIEAAKAQAKEAGL